MPKSYFYGLTDKINTRRLIPRWLVGVVVLAYLIPIFKEIFFYEKLEWLWFLYIIPALVLAYYQGLRGAIINIFLSGGLIIFTETYYHLVLGELADLATIVNVSFGTIFTMAVASLVVAIISTKLQIARKSLELLFETTDTAIGVVDKEGKVIYVNKALETLMKRRRHEIIGNHHLELSPKHKRVKEGSTTYTNLILETLDTGKRYFNYEIARKDGVKEKYIIIDTYPLKNDLKEIIGAVANIRDITEKRDMERKVQQSEKFNVLGQMAAGLAHEIRNPLTSVKGFLQIFQGQEIDAKRKEYLGLMLSELERVNKLLTEFLLLAKKTQPKQEKCSLDNLVEDVVSFMNCEAILKNAQLATKIQKNLPPVYIDKEQIKQVVINLIQNSIEAMAKKGGLIKVEVAASLNVEEVIIEISDNGTGIEKELLEKIFDPFYTTKEEGTGLGLAISYQIIENHGGWLKVTSQRGKGTKVRFGLPILYAGHVANR